MSDAQTNSPVIIKDNLAPARTLVEDFDQKLKKVHIQEGPGASEYKGKNDKIPPAPSLCIMEATAWLLGYENVNDSPPCTSDEITQLCITLNDHIPSDRKRGKLKEVIPHIINTAPTYWKESLGNICRRKVDGIPRKIGRFPSNFRLATLEDDPDYKKAEGIRADMITEFCKKHTTMKWKRDHETYYNPDEDHMGVDDLANKLSMPTWIAFIIELANVAHFGKRNTETDGKPLPPLVQVKIPNTDDIVMLESLEPEFEDWRYVPPKQEQFDQPSPETGAEQDEKPSQENPNPGEPSSPTLPFGGDGQDTPNPNKENN